MVDPSSSASSTSLLYDEPGTWSWSKPIADYSTIQSYPQSIHVQIQRDIEPGIRIKTEFKNDDYNTKGGFTIQACDTTIESKLSWPERFNVIPQVNENGSSEQPPTPPDNNNNNNNNHDPLPTIQMYAYNLYMERGTMSPEPQLLFSNLRPGGSPVEWTQTITIRPMEMSTESRPYDNENIDTNNINTMMVVEDETSIQSMAFLPTAWLTNLLPGYKAPTSPLQPSQNPHSSTNSHAAVMMIMIVSTMSLVLWITSLSLRRRRQRRNRQHYEIIV
jgi:hypothetical protein